MKKIILFIFMFLMFNTCVYASSHLDLVPIDGVYSSQFNLSTGGYFSSNQKKYFMDGKIVYCIEPGTPIYTNEFYGVGDLSLSGIEQKTIDLISLIGYFGYDYPGHQTDKYFLATQELIWESVGNNEIYFTTGINGTGNIVNVDYEKNKIMSLVNSYYVKPSFDGNLVSGVYSDKIVLEDTNNVLSNYTVISSNNSAYIDGNKLIISLDSLGSDEITLVRNKYDQLSSVFYGDSESQDFMFLRANDVFSSVYIDVFSPRNKINIDKKGLMLDGIDSDNNFIYHERGLDGVIFGLYASEDIYENELIYYKDQLIEEMVTVDGGCY